MLAHHFGLLPWDLDRLTLPEFNTYVEYGNQLTKREAG